MSGLKIDAIQAAVNYLLAFKEVPDYVFFTMWAMIKDPKLSL